ncbi:MAG: hypothetical protein ACJAZC_001643 [Cryomorphaceae bacterium]|jgi:hypothetical protein
MKNKTILLLVALFLVAGSQAFAQKDKKKVAVVTFYVDKHIDFSELGNSAALAGSVASLAEDPNFDLTPILDEFHTAFFEELSKSFSFDLVDEAVILNNELYKVYENFGSDAANEEKGLFQSLIVQDGYKALIEVSTLSADKHQAELDMIEMFGDVDGVMFVSLDYSFVKKIAVGGTGSAGMAAFARVKLWNREGKKVFADNESSTGKKSVAIIGGVPVMSLDKIIPLCQSATDRLIVDLKKSLPKKAGKIDKKL